MRTKLHAARVFLENPLLEARFPRTRLDDFVALLRAISRSASAHRRCTSALGRELRRVVEVEPVDVLNPGGAPVLGPPMRHDGRHVADLGLVAVRGAEHRWPKRYQKNRLASVSTVTRGSLRSAPSRKCDTATAACSSWFLPGYAP